MFYFRVYCLVNGIGRAGEVTMAEKRLMHAMLFDSQEGEEELRVDCAIDDEGSLHVMQVSSGPLTSWCFEESEHSVETIVPVQSVSGLLDHLELETPGQLLAALQIDYAGRYEASQLIRSLVREAGGEYEVVEHAVQR